MRKFVLLALVLCSSALAEPSTLTLTDIHGQVFEVATSQVRDALLRAGPPKGQNEKTTNQDGSVTIFNPVFGMNGRYYPIAYPFVSTYNELSLGVCNLFGFTRFVQHDLVRNTSISTAAYLDRNGQFKRLGSVRTGNDDIGVSSVLTWIICRT